MIGYATDKVLCLLIDETLTVFSEILISPVLLLA